MPRTLSSLFRSWSRSSAERAMGHRSDQQVAAPHEGRLPQRLELKIKSDPANLRTARIAVERFCVSAGLDEKACGEVGLCVNEALANVIRHAYDGASDRPILIQAESSPTSVQVNLRDWGRPFNADQRQPAPQEKDPLQPGGLGLICLKRLMDEIVYTPQQEGTLLKMVKNK